MWPAVLYKIKSFMSMVILRLFYNIFRLRQPSIIPTGLLQLVQRRMVLVVNFFESYKSFSFCFVAAILDIDLVHDVEAILSANSIWKSFLKYEYCRRNCKLQFHGHHSYFRKDFHMLLAVKEGEI